MADFEEALVQINRLSALIWAAKETDDLDMKDNFVFLMQIPLEGLIEAMKRIEEDL